MIVLTKETTSLTKETTSLTKETTSLTKETTSLTKETTSKETTSKETTSEVQTKQGVWDFIQSLPPSTLTAEECEHLEREFQEDRNSWGD